MFRINSIALASVSLLAVSLTACGRKEPEPKVVTPAPVTTTVQQMTEAEIAAMYQKNATNAAANADRWVGT